jgi:hypothetical protein
VDELGASFAGGTSFIASLGYQPASKLIQQAQLYVRTNAAGAGGYVLGITKTDGSAIVFSPAVFADGQTLFIVVGYTFLTGSSTNDAVQLWVNPDPTTFGATTPPPATVTAAVTGSDIAQIDRLNLRQNLASNIPEAMMFDELRVATNWAEVTPPATVVSPPLEILPTATNVLLRWPANRRGFALETSANLGLPAAWNLASNNVSVAGGSFIASYVPSGDARFFRLRGAFLPGVMVESPQYGYDFNAPEMTDALRLSDRTGVNWFVLNTPRQSPETGVALPYGYGDGYVEWIGATNAPTRTPAEAALRWYKIKNGQGDPWTGASAAAVGFPAIILLDEITTSFKDTLQGPAFREALRLYITQYGGSRDDLIAYVSRSVSLTPNNSLYGDVVFCANNYLRFLALELYVTQEAYVVSGRKRVFLGRGADERLLKRACGG